MSDIDNGQTPQQENHLEHRVCGEKKLHLALNFCSENKICVLASEFRFVCPVFVELSDIM